MLDLEPIKERLKHLEPYQKWSYYPTAYVGENQIIIENMEQEKIVAIYPSYKMAGLGEFFSFAITDIPALIAEVERLRKEIEDAPVVYTGPGLRDEQFWDTVSTDGYTHTAKLVCIEEIKND